MLFTYKAIDDKGANKEGEIDAPSRDAAISDQRRPGRCFIREEGEKSIFHFLLKRLNERL